MAEKTHGSFIRANGKAFHACTDLSDGGLALAAFEMAEGAGLGLTLTTADIATLYGEDQARYLVALPASVAFGVTALSLHVGQCCLRHQKCATQMHRQHAVKC